MSSSLDHRRGDSVAYRRTPSSPEKAGRTTNNGGGGGGATRPLRGHQRNATVDLIGHLQSRRQRTLVLRVVLSLLFVFGAFHFLSSWGYSRKVHNQTVLRKAKLGGAGESHVLPKRWRDHDAGENVVTTGESLGACRRVLLFKFSGTHGFSSEINAYLRAAVIAQKLGYVLLADDQDWNYGALRDYFIPRNIFCRPPSDWFLTEVATALGQKRWQGQDRVWFSRELLSKADDWFRDETLDSDSLAEIRAGHTGLILPEGDTLHPSLEEVFVDFSSALKDLWKPNDELAIMIRRQRIELGVGEGGLRNRKNSPTWGGNRRHGEKGERKNVEDVEDEEEHDFEEAGGAERADRGPVIGAHVSPEMVKKGAKGVAHKLFNGEIKYEGNYTATTLGIQDALRRLSSSTIASPSYSRLRPTIFPSTSVPHIVLLTGDTSPLVDFTTAYIPPTSSLPPKIRYSRTSQPSQSALSRWSDLLRLKLSPHLTPPITPDPSTILTSYSQPVFNSLPLPLRILLTRHFLRDLTTLSWYADAVVVSGERETGKLVLSLCGEDGVVGPREIGGRGVGGRCRSVKGAWLPVQEV